VLPIEDMDVYDLIDASYELPNGSEEKLELLERAVALADSLKDIELGCHARNELIEACAFSGHPEKAMVAYAWLLATFDKYGKEKTGLDEHDVLWKYKWFINDLWGFPAITHEKIEGMFTDFEKRLLKGGYGLRTLYYFQLKYAQHRDDEKDMDTYYKKWQKTKRDNLSDCKACETNFHVSYLAGRGEYERALEVANPILKGRESCAEVPHSTYATVLKPLLHLGLHDQERYEEAVTYHQQGYKLIRNNPDFLMDVAEHLEFLAYSHNLGPALSLFERHLPWALETADVERLDYFYTATLPLWERLKARGDTLVKVRVPKHFAVQGDVEGLNLLGLEKHIKKELVKLAKQFDARNKTSSFSDSLEVDQDLLQQTPKLVLTKPRSKRVTKEH
jgi:tetratricopeptide (TPR) repeat protein